MDIVQHRIKLQMYIGKKVMYTVLSAFHLCFCRSKSFTEIYHSTIFLYKIWFIINGGCFTRVFDPIGEHCHESHQVLKSLIYTHSTVHKVEN
jgi:hypothetical protein